MKKFYSLILVLAVIFSAFNVFADENDSGWIISYVGAEKDGDRYAAYEYDKKLSGEASMKIVYNVKPKVETNYLEIRNNLSGEMPDGNYTFSFSGLGSLSSYTEISISDVNVFSHKNDMTAEVLENGWTKYTISFAYNSQSDNFVALRFYRSIAGLYIDDVELIREGDSENIIEDGGFDGGSDVDEEETPYDTSDFRPVNVMCSQGMDMLVLNWINPATDELKDIKLYDITGEEILLSDSIDITPGAIINYPVTVQDDNERYYKIVFSYRTKQDFVFYTGGTIYSGLDSYIDAWKIRRIRNGDSSWCPAVAAIDSSVSKTGEASMKIVSNIDRNLANLQKSTYIGLQIEAPLKAGKKFRIGFSGKSKNSDYNLLVVTVQGSSWKSRYTTDVFKGTVDEWTEYTFEHESVGEDALFLVYEGSCEGLWLDDFEIYELDENGNEIGNNLLPDGSFESLLKDDGILPGLDAEAGTDKIDITWSKISSECNKVNLYIKRFDNFELIGNLPKNAGGVKISGLKKGEEYLFRIVPEHKFGYEIAGTEKTVTTILPEFEIFDTEFIKDGEGFYSVSTGFKNNLIESGVNIAHFVAVYNKKDELVAFKSAEKLIGQTASTAKPVTVTESFELPEDDYRIEVFVLDSKSDLNILRDCQIFE